MVIFFLAVFGFYFLLLLFLLLGWVKAIRKRAETPGINKYISVVIAMRNEESNLDALFQSLADQIYSAFDFEIIIVDDHSSDRSIAIATRWSNRFSSLTILSLSEDQSGKKAALTIGINQARGEVIAFTDADCVLPKKWLSRINGGFAEEHTSMLIGSVALSNDGKFFSQLQSIEFASVIGIGLATAALGKPFMCNSANLSFRKRLFDEVGGYKDNIHIASGDDEFLMRKFLALNPNSVRVLNWKDSVVLTKPQASLHDFIHQRLRWASKWKSNSSSLARLLAIFILVVQLSWLALALFLIVNQSKAGIAISIVKVVLELVFLALVCQSLKMRFNLLAFVCLQFFYPIYVLYTGIFSQFTTHEWKGRQGRDTVVEK